MFLDSDQPKELFLDFCYSAMLLDCNGSMNVVQQQFWPSIVMKKWLNIQPKVYDFSEDEIDTETESEDDGTMMLQFSSTNVSVSLSCAFNNIYHEILQLPL